MYQLKLHWTVFVAIALIGVFTLIAIGARTSHNRYDLVTSEGRFYKIDRKTGASWMLSGSTAILVAPRIESGK